MSFLIFSDGYTEGVMNPHVAKENKFNVMCVLFSRYKCFFSYSHNLLNAHHSILFQLIKNDPLKLLHENDEGWNIVLESHRSVHCCKSGNSS